MITADVYQIQHIHTRLFFQIDGWAPNRARHYYWKEDQTEAGMWREAEVDRFLDERQGEFADMPLRKVPGPACGCCGARYWNNDPYSRARPKLVVESRSPFRRVWRCEKHVGRAPCCIEGCGRTFAIQPDESYRVTYACGKHWSLAPKWMRNAVARVRRIARRRGWDDQLEARHHRLWFRCIREVRKYREAGGEGRIDIAEIERLFG